MNRTIRFVATLSWSMALLACSSSAGEGENDVTPILKPLTVVTGADRTCDPSECASAPEPSTCLSGEPAPIGDCVRMTDGYCARELIGCGLAEHAQQLGVEVGELSGQECQLAASDYSCPETKAMFSACIEGEDGSDAYQLACEGERSGPCLPRECGPEWDIRRMYPDMRKEPKMVCERADGFCGWRCKNCPGE